MSDSVSQTDVEASRDQEQEVEKLFAEQFLTLADDDAAKLSKVLFPTTHSKSVEFCDKTLELHVVPIKVAKKLFSLLQDFVKKHESALKTPEVVSLDQDVTNGMFRVAKELATHYKWDSDIVAKINDEDVSVSDLQSLCYVQQNLNGANDFLLSPLRVLVRLMQVHEIANTKFQNMLTSRLSAKNKAVA